MSEIKRTEIKGGVTITKDLIKDIEGKVTCLPISKNPPKQIIVNDVNKAINAQNYDRYKIADFYNANTIIKTLQAIKLPYQWLKHEIPVAEQAELFKRDVDYDQFINKDSIQAQLVAHKDEVLKFIENIKNAELVITYRNDLPPTNTKEYKKLTKYIVEGERTYSHKVTQESIDLWQKQQDGINNKKHPDGTPYTEDEKKHIFGYKMPKPTLGKVTTRTVKGWVVNDAKGLIDLIKSYPLVARYKIDTTAISQDEHSLYMPDLVMIYDLAVACEIKPQATYNDGVINETNGQVKELKPDHRIILEFLTQALIEQLKAKIKKDNERREVVNIKNAQNHDVLMQPHAIGLTDMIDGAFEGRELKNLYKEYRKGGYGSNDEIKKEGGWLVHLAGQQSELPLDYGEQDRKTIVKFMTQTKALVIDVTTALGRYFREHPDHKPDDYISLIDLARYIGRFNDSKLKKNELRPAYRQQILNGLTMAQLISADYVVSKDKRGNKEWRKVYLLDRITDYKTYGNTDIVTGVKVDFTKEYKESVGLNIGVILDGVLLLSTPEHKALGAYILERFAQHQEMTTRGEPQKITADNLIKKAGITDNNKTNKLNTLQKALDTFVENGLIAKWACKNGAKNITGYDKESQTILVYPTKNLKTSYAPVSQTRAEKQAIKLEQKNRHTALTKWLKGYTNLDRASKDLGITRPDLNELVAGTKIISDDILDKINDL